MQLNRRAALGLLGAGAALLGAPRLAFGQETKELIVAMDTLPSNLDPLLYLTNPGYRVMQNIFDTLLTVDLAGDGALQPALAESWTRIDGKTLELVLRQGVKFHDGSPLTVDDVVFSFGETRRTSPDSPGYGTAQQFLKTIATVEAVDDKTIRVTAVADDPALELRLTAWGSQIISKAAFEAAGGFEGFGQKPIGTGPFAVVSLNPDTVQLAAFADHFRGAPKLAALTYRQAAELSSRIAGMLSGEFDIAVDIPSDQFSAIQGSPDLEMVGGEVASIRVVKFDTRNETLKDVRIRKAIGLAVDRKAIVDSFWGGLVTIPNGEQLPSFGPLYDPDRVSNAYDPAEATRLLQEAGYDGTPIPYRVNTGQYGPELAVAQVLVAMWEAVGLKIDLQIKETFAQLMEYPGTGMRNGVDPVLVNDPLFGLWRSYDQSERDVWTNEEFYKHGAILETSLDVEERKAAFQAMMDIFDEDPPAFILHTMGVFYAKKKTVEWDPVPSVFLYFSDADKA